MALDFSLFADDMVLEVLGYLPALDIVRYRRVCRRVYQASKERCVWVNVFARTKCAHPFVDLSTTTTKELENILLRAEIMDAKWTGTCPTAPQFHQSPVPGERSSFVGSMGPWVVFTHWLGEETKYAWYPTMNPEDPVFEYRIPVPLLQTPVCQIEPGTNMLHLAYIPQEPTTPQRLLKIVRFRLSKGGSVLKSLERDIELPNLTTPWTSVKLCIGDGYVLLSHLLSGLVTLKLLHIATGRCITVPVHNDHAGNHDGISFALPVPIITSSHLLVLDGKRVMFFELPTQAALSGTHPIGTLQKTHDGILPYDFNEAHLFPRSQTSFAVVGLRSSMREQCVRVHLLTIELRQYPQECLIRETFVYEVAGQRIKFTLPPPPLSSTAALGLLITRVIAPTHDSRGRRISRRETSRVYYLAVRVSLEADSVRESISLTDLAMVSDANDAGVAYHSFDPYTGRIFFEDFRSHSSIQLLVGDYLSISR